MTSAPRITSSRKYRLKSMGVRKSIFRPASSRLNSSSMSASRKKPTCSSGRNSARTSISLDSEKRPVSTEPNRASLRIPLRLQSSPIRASGISICATVIFLQLWLRPPPSRRAKLGTQAAPLCRWHGRRNSGYHAWGGGRRRGGLFQLPEPEFQHQQRPQPALVVAAAAVMLLKQVLQKRRGNDLPVQKAGRAQMIPDKAPQGAAEPLA